MVFKIIDVNEEFISDMEAFRGKPSTMKLVEGSSVNPVYFSEHMIGMRPYAWQTYVMELFRRAVRERAEYLEIDISHMDDPLDSFITITIDGQEFVIITSRQIGKSTLIALLSLWVTLFNKVPAGVAFNTTVMIVSASDVQSRSLLYEMKKLMRMGDLKMSEYLDGEDNIIFGKEYFSSLLSVDDPNNTTTITYVHGDEKKYGSVLLRGSRQGSSIKSYPPTASVLGQTGSVLFIDEAGKYDRISDEFVYDFFYPVGNSTNAIRGYTSTPWEPKGFYYRMVDPENLYGDGGYIICAFTIEAIKLENPKYYDTVMKTVTTMIENGQKDEVARAYYCRFVKGESSYFDPEKVPVVFDQEIVMVPSYTGLCDMGIDVGGTVNSHTVVTISMMDEEGHIHRLFHLKYPVQGDLSLLDDIEKLMEVFNIQRIIIDDAPSSDLLIRKMEQERHWEVQRFNFRSEKVKRYTAFRDKFLRGMIHSYPDKELQKEMDGLEHSKGSRQSVIQHAPGYKDDIIDSWLISSYFYVDVVDRGTTFIDWNKPVPKEMRENPIVDRALERLRKRQSGFYGRR